MLQTEHQFLPLPNYYAPAFQPQITAYHRERLVEWLIGLQANLRLLPETLFITVNIVDRYLSRKRLSLKQLQLLGLTALFIASKF